MTLPEIKHKTTELIEILIERGYLEKKAEYNISELIEASEKYYTDLIKEKHGNKTIN